MVKCVLMDFILLAMINFRNDAHLHFLNQIAGIVQTHFCSPVAVMHIAYRETQNCVVTSHMIIWYIFIYLHLKAFELLG